MHKTIKWYKCDLYPPAKQSNAKSSTGLDAIELQQLLKSKKLYQPISNNNNNMLLF